MRLAIRFLPPWVRTLAGIFLLMQGLLTAGYAGYTARWSGFRQFNMDGELNLPTWWSSLIVITTAGVCFGLWQTTARLGRPSSQWFFIGLGFLGLSAEEIASIHEDVGASVGGGPGNVSIWPLVYSPVVIVGAWMMVRAVRDLPRSTATLALTGLISYIAVLGIELASLVEETAITIAVEENLEMLGTGLMFVALASELTSRFVAVFPGAPDPRGEQGVVLERTLNPYT